jgi:type IV secretory pathway TraG/TraD family ATPase VirD4
MSDLEDAAKKYNVPLATAAKYNLHTVAKAFEQAGHPLTVPKAVTHQPQNIKIPYDIRNQHVYVPGKTRHGKSTLFHAMATQDIKNGHGVCVIDPKGDLVNSLLNWIPETRKDDCVYISPKTPVPINFLDYIGDSEKETLVGELKYVITRNISAEAAPLMDAIITDLIWTLVSARDNPTMPAAQKPTFLDIYRFLSNQERRDYIMRFVTDPELRLRWDTNFPNPKECAPTITRMTPFLRNPSLRKLFDCPQPELSIANLMDNRKMLLVDLGGISESTKILATLLIAKIKQAAFRRASIPESERIPFFVYVDEFKFFQTSDFEDILSFAGGYGLRLTLANQFIGQLDGNIRQSIFGNVGSFIVFCVSPDDAKFYRHIAPEDVSVAHLPKYRALYKIAGQPPIVKDTPAPPPPPSRERIDRAEYIRKRTLERYACKCAPASYPLRRWATGKTRTASNASA